MGKDDFSAVAVIPARLASERFPRKALADICGKPMIAHVVQRALEAESLHEVLVATDDADIARAAEAAGAHAVMTGECASGTDRVAEAALGRSGWDLLLNIQGDEPLLSAANIDVLVKGMMEHRKAEMGTLCRPLTADQHQDPNIVKLVRRRDGRALYFSRAPVPFFRDSEAEGELLRKHLGIYAYRRDALRAMVSMPPSELEKAEKLEQLRALENGMDIMVFDAPDDAWGVDTEEDLRMVEKLMRNRGPGC